MIVADREMVESSSDDILNGADKDDVAFLVVGDPFGYLTSLLPFIVGRLVRLTYPREPQHTQTFSSAPVS